MYVAFKGENNTKTIPRTFFSDKGNHAIQITGTIILDKEEKLFYQTIIPTKFGYLMILAYQNSDIAKQNCKFSEEGFLTNMAIDDNFEYIEPQSKSNLTIWKIVIAFLIGLTVYGAIIYAPKLKKLVMKIIR